ncbi:MAG: 5'-nucleotidase C-terminal domain-containing protein [Bryobacteraceae bacterium]
MKTKNVERIANSDSATPARHRAMSGAYTEQMRLTTRKASVALFVFLSTAIAGNAARIQLTVLATTDLHGNLYPVDYFTGRPANRGLAKIATLVRAARVENPNSLLIDCGDTIQGTSLEYLYQTYVRTGRIPLNLKFAGEPLRHDPMMLAMNALGYDAMVLGNHEFNFGLKNLARAREDARFPWISANTHAASGRVEKPFAPYLLKTVAGVKVAVIGITTPTVPSWEKPENLGSYRFEASRTAVESAIAALRALPGDKQPDLVVVAAHAGLGRDPNKKSSGAEDLPGENTMYDVASHVPGIDAIVFGHTHAEVAEMRVNGVLLTQPKNWGISLARLDFTLESKPGGGFTVVEKTSRVIPASATTVPDEEVLRIAKPYHELAERYLNTEVAQSAQALDGSLSRVEDTALIDAVQQVQLHYTKADVSLTAAFNTRAKVPRGPVTVRQIASLYVYENELYTIEGDGKMLKDALENAARYYLSCARESCGTGPLVNSRVIGFNYDMAQGVEYEVDLAQPEGQRIRNLRYKGKPLDPGRKLKIAVNNYRAGGGAGYTMFRGAPILWRSSEDIRQLIIDYFTEHRTLPVKPDNNWRVTPDAARMTLERDALKEAGRANLQ